MKREYVWVLTRKIRFDVTEDEPASECIVLGNDKGYCDAGHFYPAFRNQKDAFEYLMASGKSMCYEITAIEVR